ncbi:MAG: putative DNA binding domain-containing protein [Chloroflexi bacterium]|nr:putative DNA binding domain-containing protein [Chloroflexota bacterium]
MPQRKKSSQRQWRRMDLHLHTPASADYKQSGVSYLDFLKKAEDKGLDIVAFTDHNSVMGYARFLQQVETLETLARLDRMTDEERKQLGEYRRLREKLLILPGFELTATLGFHILAIFQPETTVRELDHLLMSLNVPADKLDDGSGEVGATTDVLTAYRMVNQAGGLVIAAHANSSHGVAMPGFDFGGQTRIAYTQDSNLHALEVTDLESRSRRRTAMFFNGIKPEYPRRMHCIQGSDAHKLDYDAKFKNEMGVGDRATEILLDDVSFDAIKDVFVGNDFSRTRPYRAATEEPFDPIREAREQGETLVQAFHEKMLDKRNVAPAILQDVVALANTNGGTIYIGANAHARQPVVGVERVEHAIADLKSAISKQINPPLDTQIEALKSQGKTVLQMIVPRGSDVPYALDGAHIYVRSENETTLAMRDEIVQLVRESLAVEFAASPVSEPLPPVEHPAQVQPNVPAPRTGVEIVASDVRKGTHYYSVRDLRNSRIVQNVTLASARSLWQYAISEHEKNPVKAENVQWTGDIGIWKTHKRGGKMRYDLAQRVGDKVLVYYGVTDDGMDGAWHKLVEGENGGEDSATGETRSDIGMPTEIAAEYDAMPDTIPLVGHEPAADMIPPPVLGDEIESYIPPEDLDETATLVMPPAALGEYDEFRTPLGEPLPPADDFEPEAEFVATSDESTMIVDQSPEEVAPPFEMLQSEPEELVPPFETPESEPTSPPLAESVAPPAPKTRAQTWREKLERAMAAMNPGQPTSKSENAERKE